MSAAGRLAGLVILLGCSGVPPGVPMAEPEPDGCITGLLRSTGTEGFTQLVLREEGGSGTVLVGEERDTLLRLSGAVVTACGSMSAHAMGPELTVETWTLRTVDGQEAHVGRLVETPDGLALALAEAGGDLVALRTAPEALRELVGRTVWVAGRWTGSRFEPEAFGLVR
ncbi:MAG: hypothetical protein P8170_18050 [Gemmatimonadota bacterium]